MTNPINSVLDDLLAIETPAMRFLRINEEVIAGWGEDEIEEDEDA